jgi:hypothetical protein
MWAYPIIWSHIRKDGIMVSDDVQDNPAFYDFFVQELKLEPTILEYEGKLIGIIRK